MVLPLFTLKLSGKPVAIIKGGDKTLHFVKINKFESKYFATQDGGVFELDDSYEYRYKNTSIYFYNFSNPKPLNLKAMEEIDDKLRTIGDIEMLNRERYVDMIASQPDVDVEKMNIPPDHTRDLSPETRRFLQDYSTDDEATKTNMMIKVSHQKKPIKQYSTPLINMGTNRGHFAFIQIGHKRLDITPMVVHNDRAYTKYGVFEFTRDNLYAVKKQMIGFFVLNSTEKDPATPLPRKANGMMKHMIKKGQWSRLETFFKPINADKKKAYKPNGKNVSISSEKSLAQFVSDSPSIFHTTLNEIYEGAQAVNTELSDPLKKAIPIIVIMAGLMGFVMLISNLPPIMDKIAELTGMAPPKIVYLTPDQAGRAGLNVNEIPVAPPYDENGNIVYDANGLPTNPENAVSSDITFEGGEPIAPIDTEPPDLLVPEDYTLESLTPNGMKVNYDVSSTDPTAKITCSPVSGKVLPIGENTIFCEAVDEAGNKTVDSFTVTIEGEERQLGFTIIPPLP